MKIYLASAAPNNENERTMLLHTNRLLSYYHITTKILENDKVFYAIKKLKMRKPRRRI